jgi:hypothetical protein
MEKKRGQHYVWRKYLTAWINGEGEFYCLRDNKIFPANPKDIGKSRDFYRLKDLSPFDIQLITQLFINNQAPPEIQELNKNWILQFTQIFEIKRSLEKKGIVTDVINSKIDTLINNIEEDHQSRIEDMALPYLNLLREGNVNFYKTDDGNINFNLFLCTQYFRTKKIKMAVINSINTSTQTISPQIDIEKIWNVCSHIFATNMSHQLYINKNNYSCLILKNDTFIPFITCDQPVINTYADYSTNKVTEDLELYYPLTPSLSLLITKSVTIPKNFPLELDEHEVTKYNNYVFNASEEQVYANEMSVLQSYIK